MALTSARFKNNNRLQAAARNANAMCWGERSEPVAIVQKAYVDLGYSMPGSTQQDGALDGIFGKETYAATRSFQSKHSLGVDGVIGKQTLHELDRLPRRLHRRGLPGPSPFRRSPCRRSPPHRRRPSRRPMRNSKPRSR